MPTGKHGWKYGRTGWGAATPALMSAPATGDTGVIAEEEARKGTPARAHPTLEPLTEFNYSADRESANASVRIMQVLIADFKFQDVWKSAIGATGWRLGEGTMVSPGPDHIGGNKTLPTMNKTGKFISKCR